jgi:hypothetical protein
MSRRPTKAQLAAASDELQCTVLGYEVLGSIVLYRLARGHVCGMKGVTLHATRITGGSVKKIETFSGDIPDTIYYSQRGIDSVTLSWHREERPFGRSA